MAIPNYQTPGVYVSQTQYPNVGALSTTSPNILFLAFVPSGQSPTNPKVDTFLVQSGNSTFTLTQSGTITGFVASNNVTGVSYVASGTVNAVASGFNVSNPVTTNNVTQFTVSGLPANTWVNVNYNYGTVIPGVFYTFNDFNSVQSLFGPAFSYVNGTPTVTSPNTLAAYLAFQNGAQVVTCTNIISTTNSGTTGEFFNAIVSGTQFYPGVDVIVPLKYDSAFNSNATWQTSALFTPLTNYLTAQANNGTFQRAFLGLDQTVASGTNPSLINTAQLIDTTLNSSRVTVVAPQSVTYNPGLNTTNGSTTGYVNLDGIYLTAAIAGVFAGQPNVATPITNKTVTGFIGIPNQISANDSNVLQSFGTTVVRQNNFGTLTIRQGLTTNVTNWLTQEISINAIGDQLAKALTNALNNSGLIGSPLTQTNVHSLESVVASTLQYAVKTGLIQAYLNLSFSQSPSNTTQINVTFTYSPTIPLNYIQVTMSIDSSTGSITF